MTHGRTRSPWSPLRRNFRKTANQQTDVKNNVPSCSYSQNVWGLCSFLVQTFHILSKRTKWILKPQLHHVIGQKSIESPWQHDQRAQSAVQAGEPVTSRLLRLSARDPDHTAEGRPRASRPTLFIPLRNKLALLLSRFLISYKVNRV